VVAAVAWRPVGVDVEQLAHEPHSQGVLRRVCSPKELARLERLPPDQRGDAFLRVWTRKEAYGKASGLGMGFQLRDVTVGLRGSRVRGVRGRWWVTNLDLGPERVAALVVAGGRARLRLEAVEAASL
jgi:4'-phosphopantetheinyl transferase